MNRYLSLGFTYLEMILVVGIIAAISTSAAAFFSNSIQINNLQNTVDMFITTLRKAQFYSISGKNNTDWGVCLSSNKIRLFTGTCASPTFSEDFSIPSNIGVSNFNSVTFSHSRGEPSAPQTITLTNNFESNTINLNPIGGLTIN